MSLQVPYFRPEITEAEIAAVVECLRGGWLTTGPRVREFEAAFCAATGAAHAVALNSCTAALHLAVEALGLQTGQGVLVPTMTFAATAEVVRYLGAVPILVDCDATHGNLCLEDAERKLAQLRNGELGKQFPRDLPVVGIMPVHVGGMMLNMADVQAFAQRHHLWVVEDAAHAFPAAWRRSPHAAWQRCGENTAHVTCFSFYANKTITTGEGGMAVTNDTRLAERMRSMSLHGLSNDAWNRFAGGKWDYRIVAPGYKYNLTDLAAALGLQQLARAESMRQARESLAGEYRAAFTDCEEVELPSGAPDRLHAWHLFPLRLRLERLRIDRNEFLQSLKDSGIGCSVHWRPLHLHPYYRDTFGWEAEQFPQATQRWECSLSLPLFPGMRAEERQHVVATVLQICSKNRISVSRSAHRSFDNTIPMKESAV